MSLIIAGTAPEILKKLKPVILLAGEDVEFLCEIDLGDPVSEVEWDRQGRTVRTSERVVSSVNGTKASLTIKQCAVEDIGLYTVRASNKLGAAESEASLTVNCEYLYCRMIVKVIYICNSSYILFPTRITPDI